MLNRIEFVVSEALTALSRHRLMTLAAVSTVAVSLFLFGGLGYAYYRMTSFASTIPGKFRMLVYLREDATSGDVSAIAAKMRRLAGVSSVAFIPKDKAWERWKLEHATSLTEGIENPLPDGFRVVLSDLKESDQVVDAIKAIPMVDEVRYMREEQNLIENMLALFRWIGIVVGGTLFVTAGVLIYNAIRLTVLSRRLEIRIMQLVGASRATVYIPFLIEGMLQGVIGAVIATGLIIGAYFGFTWVVRNNLSFAYAPGIFPYAEVLGILVAAGALYGVFCSVLAVRAPLKYR